MRAPIVMALGNRALSGPINIHCDHSDSMLIRDSGVVQLFAENAQEAYDLTVLAPRLAEQPDVLLPVLVCQDGFTITHSAEPVELLPDDAVRRFVGEYARAARAARRWHARRRRARSRCPTTTSSCAAPQAAALDAALPAFDGGRVGARTGHRPVARASRALPARRRGARVVVAMGSTAGTAKDGVDALRDDGEPVGLLRVVSFRPFPRAAVAEALADAGTVVVLDRADSPGGAPPLFAEMASVLYGSGRDAARPCLRPRRPRPPSRGPARDRRGRARPHTSA